MKAELQAVAAITALVVVAFVFGVYLGAASGSFFGLVNFR